MQDRFQGVLEYEARMNRRDAAEAAARPDPVLRALQLESERRGVLFGAEHPEAAAEGFIARVQSELRNRRKTAALVPELASPEMEALFVSSVAQRISEGADVLRRQIEAFHCRAAQAPPREAAPRSAPELLAAHEEAVEAQRRSGPVNYERVFPREGRPDLRSVERFHTRARAVFALIETEFGLMRLRAGSGLADPGESSGFRHIPVYLTAEVRSLSSDVEALRKGWPEAATFADSLQSLTAAAVRAAGVSDARRLETVRLLHQFAEALTRGVRQGERLDFESAARTLRELEAAISRIPDLAAPWSRCWAEFSGLYAARSRP